MTKCSYCSQDELLPFTCSYCQKKFCRKHHLPEKHECTEVTKEKLKSKRYGEVTRGRVWSIRPNPPSYKKAYKIPGVTEVIEKAHSRRRTRSTHGHFDVDEKLIAGAILFLIIILGLISRFL
jgi:hypothetical protein